MNVQLKEGRWFVDKERVNDFTFNPLKELMSKVHNLYDGEVDYDRVDIVSNLMLLNKDEERKLSVLLRSNLLRDIKL
jgi:hypothetical protein